jgi:hypothetical protein
LTSGDADVFDDARAWLMTTPTNLVNVAPTPI